MVPVKKENLQGADSNFSDGTGAIIDQKNSQVTVAFDLTREEIEKLISTGRIYITQQVGKDGIFSPILPSVYSN